MLRCNHCHRLIEPGETVRGYDKHDEYWEPLGVCPQCGSPDIEQLVQCACCGEWVSDLVIDRGFCDVCRTIVADRFTELLFDNFTEREREFLDDLYDGEPLPVRKGSAA